MPKETVYNAYDHGDSDLFQLDLSWGREQNSVQIGTLQVEERTQRKVVDGVFVQLDRAGCNKLITALRKARDQAFGKDA